MFKFRKNSDLSNERKYEEFHKRTVVQHKVIKENNFTYRKTIEILRKYLNAEATILDVGCGAGTIDFFFAKRGYRIFGIDISEAAIQSALMSAKSMNLKNVKFKVMDFPYKVPKEKFDMILCSEVIEHLEEDQLALNRMASLLRNNGLLVLSTPSANAPLYRMGFLQSFDKKVGHLRRYKVRELETLTRNAGFRIIYVQKTEGILRNFLFTNPIAGKFVRFIKLFVSDFVTILDNFLLSIFGESNIYIVAKKI